VIQNPGKTERDPVFGFDVVAELPPALPSEILIPRNAWADKSAYDATATKLAGLFKQKTLRPTRRARVTEVKAAAPNV